MARFLRIVPVLLSVLCSLHLVLGYDTLMVVGGYYYDSDIGVNKYLRYAIGQGKSQFPQIVL